MNRKFAWAGVLLAFGLASCGGEGPGLAGGRNGGTTDPGTETPVELNSVELLTSSPQLQSDGSTTVTLSAIAKNANNQTVPEVPVVFSADSGTLIVSEASTNAQGVASAELNIGGDPTNRTITVTSRVGELNDSVDIRVIGSTLQVQGPISLVNGASGTYVATLLDSAGKGIANRPVDLASAAGNTLSTSSAMTDTSGRVEFQLTGTSSGTDTITATALPDASGDPTVSASVNVTVSADNFRFTAPASNGEIDIDTDQQITVRWLDDDGLPQIGKDIRFATTRGTVEGIPAGIPVDVATTDGDGYASATLRSSTAGAGTVTATTVDGGISTDLAVEFVATTPNQIILQTEPSVIGPDETSTITAIVKDSAGNLVKNAAVNFSLDDTTGGSLSVASAETNSEGRAQTVYTASSSEPSADNGVVITGRVIDPSTNCTSTPKILCTTAALTVGGRAVSMVFGTGDSIIENATDTTYTKDYTLFVRDSSGAGVGNATVNVSIVSTKYYKGVLEAGVTHYFRPADAPLCNSEDIDNDGVLDGTEDANNNGVLDAGEDTDGDGVLDLSEDINADGELTPGGVAIVAPGTITTDETGQADFQIIYPQDHAMWVVGQITAAATVAGTESRRSTAFDFPASAEDLAIGSAPPNFESPWGPADPDDNPATANPFETAPTTCQNIH